MSYLCEVLVQVTSYAHGGRIFILILRMLFLKVLQFAHHVIELFI